MTPQVGGGSSASQITSRGRPSFVAFRALRRPDRAPGTIRDSTAPAWPFSGLQEAIMGLPAGIRHGVV